MTLTIKDLRKSFKDVDALKSLTFTLEPGAGVALLGPNGAGKSTAVKILVTLLKPDNGAFLWQGEDLLRKPEKIRRLVSYVSQEMAMDKMLTGLEFMRFCAGLLHLNWKQHRAKAEDILDRMGLTEAKHRLVGTYSGGMKRRLDLAAALLKEPKILILDEPTTGLDVEARETIWELIANFKTSGGYLILASHDFREVGVLADTVLIMDHGQMAAAGTPAQLKIDLGRLIIRLKTRELMTPSDFDRIRQLFSSRQNQLQWRDDERFATLIYRGSEDMPTVQQEVYTTLGGAGLDVHSLNISMPDLEDVYRFNVGGDT